MLASVSPLTGFELWLIVAIILQYLTNTGGNGGAAAHLASFIDLVLIRWLSPVPTSVGRRLPHHVAACCCMPAGRAVDLGAGASCGAKEPAVRAFARPW